MKRIVHGDLEKNGKQKAESRTEEPTQVLQGEEHLRWGGIWGILTALRWMLWYQRSHQLTARETSAISAVTVLGILAVSLHIRCRKIARKGNKREEAHCQAPGCRAIRI